MKGRKPKPTALRLIEGNLGHRSINRNEPKPRTAAPPRPSILQGEERKAWEYLVRELKQMGTIASSDRASLTAYCHWWGGFMKAKGKLKELAAAENPHPEVIETSSGNFIQNPWLSIANTAAKELAKISEKLGLDPTSRARLTLPAPNSMSLRDELLTD